MFEPYEYVIDSVEYDKKDRRNGKIVINTSDGTVFGGIKRKDMWRGETEDFWDKYLVKGNEIRYWIIQGSRVIGVEIKVKDKWEKMWCAGNDFNTFEESEKSGKTYEDFCKKEAEKIKKMIDDGKAYKEIENCLSKDHSGFTWAWSMSWGIANAKNLSNAKKVKIDFKKEG